MTLIEKVARAMYQLENRAMDGWTWENECRDPNLRAYWLDSARAALEAMLDSTDEMDVAGFEAAEIEHISEFMTSTGCGMIWKAMVRAALKEGE